jgi:maltose O-acetyltransferase
MDFYKKEYGIKMTEKEKILSGSLYTVDGELRRGLLNARKITRQYNATTEDEAEIRKKLLSELFARIGENIYIEPPFRCDYGSNIFIGENFYANYDCVILDVNRVTIGSNVKFGPRVCVYTAGHPIDARVRRSLLEFGKPVTIGDDVWVGGNAVINPGVTIGNNVVIGSGSVVTKNIPDNVVAAGNPCRVLRPITDEDRKYWEAERDKYYGS